MIRLRHRFAQRRCVDYFKAIISMGSMSRVGFYLLIYLLLAFNVTSNAFGERIDYEEHVNNAKQSSEYCEREYEGIVPRFFSDPRTNSTWYYRYQIIPSASNRSCEEQNAFSYKLAAYSVTNSFSRTGQLVDPTFYSIPHIVNYQDAKLSISMRHQGDSLLTPSLVKTVEYIEIGKKPGGEVRFEDLRNDSKQEFRPFITRHRDLEILGLRLPDIFFDSKPAPIDVIDPGSHADSTLSVDYRWGSQPLITSNGCWLITNSSKAFKVIEQGNSGRREDNWKTFPINRVLNIYSLSHDSENGEIRCQAPKFKDDGDWASSLRSRFAGIIKHTKMELFDFHIANNKFDEPSDYFSHFPKLIEGAYQFEIDFAAFSPEANRLDIVYQKGFTSSINKYKDEQLTDDCPQNEGNGECAQDEKQLNGDLVFISFTNAKSKDNEPIFDVRGPEYDDNLRKRQTFNITKGCTQFEGWESSPSFSTDKSKLYFLARKEAGNDSSETGLYVADFKIIQRGAFDCNGLGQISNMISGLEENQYPVLNYKVNSDIGKLEIWYEERGETVIRFYKLNQSGDRILYRFPETIKGLGKIYDITRARLNYKGNDGQAFYVFHSRLNFPVSLSLCHYRNFRFVCGSNESLIHTTSYGKEIIDDHPNDPERDAVSIELFASDWKDQYCDSIPGFILKPSGKIPSKGALISVHGGPNEAWDGRFGQLEYEMASRGYTVYLPNPAGSTGYGYEHTKRGNKSWSGSIYSDIKCVVRKVKERHDKVYLAGFSFGGYIANWIQTDPDSSTADQLEALVAISPLFDTRKFSASTDQYWFPEYQLGCSGSHCQKLDCEFDAGHLMIDQNPACNIENATNKINKEGRKLPIMIIASSGDLRINYCHNIDSNLCPYRRKKVPYKFVEIRRLDHGLNPMVNILNGERIDKWFREMDRCVEKINGKWDLECEIFGTKWFSNTDEYGEGNPPHCIDIGLSPAEKPLFLPESLF